MIRKIIAMLSLMLPALAATAQSGEAQVPACLNHQANHIVMNGADWSALRGRLADAAEGRDVMRILHIGDSHIQAEFVTCRLRKLLQDRYGNAGRGLVVPLRLAGTNQSHDFSFASTGPDSLRTQTRLLRTPWSLRPGVTGIAEMLPIADTITIATTVEGHQIASATLLRGRGVETVAGDGTDSIKVVIDAGEPFYGAILENGHPGVLYSAIGNNGACYNDYLLINDFGRDTQAFDADLIILSMGTNEGFSTMTDQEIARSVRDLVEVIRAYNPDAAMLILAPMECQRNRRHGMKPLSPDYDINKRVAEAHDIIVAEAAALQVPVWDFYEVAGGEGASDSWLELKLMNRDRIHLLKAGYDLQAELMMQALTEALR